MTAGRCPCRPASFNSDANPLTEARCRLSALGRILEAAELADAESVRALIPPLRRLVLRTRRYLEEIEP